MSKVNNKPFGAFAFRVKVDGKEVGLFQEVSGLSAQIEVQDLAVGGLNTTTLKLAGPASYPNLSLKRGFCVTTMMDWFESYRAGSGNTRKRLSGTIEMLGDDGAPVMTWAFVNGIPTKWDGPQLSVSQNAIAIESLEIAHEGLQKI